MSSFLRIGINFRPFQLLGVLPSWDGGINFAYFYTTPRILKKIYTDDMESAHLAGGASVSSSEWKLRHPKSSPSEGFGRNGGSTRKPHRLMGGNFPHHRYPKLPNALLILPKVPEYRAQ